MSTEGRDDGEIEALITDRYLDALLATTAEDDRVHSATDRVDPAVRAITTRLRDELPRLHPSFRFEERLARRLADVAAGMRMPAAAGSEGAVVPIGFVRPGRDDEDDLLFDGTLDERSDRVRPLLIGGALTSAALSLAGAVYVAWRRTHPTGTPMERAVRAAAARRLT